MFSYFGQPLVDAAEIPNGTNVLDVAAGKGALLFPAAARVGPTGHVTGIDFAPNMVRETAKEIENRNPRDAEIGQMDAEQTNFVDSSFDYVLCGFALWPWELFESLRRKIWTYAEATGVIGPGGVQTTELAILTSEVDTNVPQLKYGEPFELSRAGVEDLAVGAHGRVPECKVESA